FAKVGIELAEMMEGKMRPTPVVLEARQLRKPLPEHVEGAELARSLDGGRELVVPLELDRNALAGPDLARQRQARVGLVVVAVALRLERAQEVVPHAVLHDGELLQID